MSNIIAISSSPLAHNGFGTQVHILLRGLGKAGHNATLIAMHRPQEAASHVWELPDGRTFQSEGKDDYTEWGAQRLYRIVPHGVESMYGAKMLELMLQHERPDAIVTLHDTQNVSFVGQISANMGVPWFHWLPWDNSIWEQQIAKFFMEAQCRVVLMSDFTEKLAKENHFPYIAKIYHGVNTNIYKPMLKDDVRKELGFPTDKFIIGYIGQNEERKHLDQAMRGVTDFADKLDMETEAKGFGKFTVTSGKGDLMLFMHTDVAEPYPAHWAFKLTEMNQKLNIDELYRHTPRHLFIQKFTDATMAKLYNAQDLLFSSTSGEGFGLMALYGNACGVPSAVTDINTTDQLTGGGRWGWKIPLATKYEAPGGYTRGMVNEDGVTKVLMDAYKNRDKLREFGKLARLDVLAKYNQDSIGKQWADLITKELSAT